MILSFKIATDEKEYISMSIYILSGLRSVNRNVRGYSQNKNKLSVQLRRFSAEVAEHPQTILQLCFGTIQMTACANKLYICLFVTQNMGMFIALILFICFYIKLMIIDLVYSS